MDNTFQKEITYTEFLPEVKDGQSEMVEKEITKTVTFQELSRKQKRHEKLVWSLSMLFDGQQLEETDLNSVQSILPSTDKMCDVTKRAIKTLVICDDNFTERDKDEFLSDSIACINFGFWLLFVKYKHFFLKMRPV